MLARCLNEQWFSNTLAWLLDPRAAHAFAETDIVVASPRSLPIERGLGGPRLLADTIVRRWQDHLPLYRLEQIYAREGLELARSRLCGWHAELAQLVRPLGDVAGRDGVAVSVHRRDTSMRPWKRLVVARRDRCQQADRSAYFGSFSLNGATKLPRRIDRLDASALLWSKI